MNISFSYRCFHFKRPSGTSRGVLKEKHSWFLVLEKGRRKGTGECSVIAGLTPEFESKEEYESLLVSFVEALSFVDWKRISKIEDLKVHPALSHFYAKCPSLVFGLEMAYLDFRNGGKEIYFDNSFSRSQLVIPINGLIWMGDKQFMSTQFEDLKARNFNCIKMKIGAINFDEELTLLRSIKKAFAGQDLILRVDANGAFGKDDWADKMKALAELDLHSIEQPVRQGQFDLMKEVIESNTVPVALDEELIGVNSTAEKAKLLDELKPPYIILKPSLHGGLSGSKEWIVLARQRGIKYWITSALEANPGLNCIAQFTAEYDVDVHHGLGTGSLYTDNITSKLHVENGAISLKPN
jgi:L-alanine-DL-glutamate epimerase-like enolase superfamily enzyme